MQLERVGAWLVAIGNILQAVGASQRIDIAEDIRNSYSIIGLTIEAIGIGLIIDSIDEVNEETIGTSLQGVGTLTVLYAALSDFDESQTTELDIKGNLIQASGEAYTLIGVEETLHESIFNKVGFIGVFTVIIGNISEAIAGVKELNGILAEELFEFGAIAQAVGSIVGDAFITVKQDELYAVLTQKKGVYGPPRYLTIDWETAKHSIEKLYNLQPALAVTGHGMFMSGAELTNGLHQLVVNFDQASIPDHGKYVD
ncbi:DUF6944 family repetitive protein [Geomicrobium sediminis]|uniref:Class II aldolase/adducin N-terminal domain-containing protein n=1 Tax=Geomicrobium sediminis TaxID=1347788 RepID=A0ABS2PG32_9BACL|nr:hypothetical protein [Geomicrobium sediminis]MBM7634232.1 hypothetical protein [Geomicrobium sediminis]